MRPVNRNGNDWHYLWAFLEGFGCFHLVQFFLSRPSWDFGNGCQEMNCLNSCSIQFWCVNDVVVAMSARTLSGIYG